MGSREDGGSAFPIATEDKVWEDGMSLRDYAAIKAMASLVTVTGSQDNVFGYLLGTVGGDPSERLAEIAYGLADAMLAARKET